jgi:hypothetical protein
VTDQRQLNLPLFALGAVAAHAVVLAALLPMLVTLPGPGSSPRAPLIIDVDVTPGASLAPAGPQPEPSLPADAGTTSALPLEPSPPAPAETAAAIAADPMTTQSTPPMADAESGGAPSDSAKTHANAGLPTPPPAGAAPAPSLARAEPPDTLPPAAPSAATEQATANAPKAEALKPVEAPGAKKATAVRAQPVTPHVNRVVKAKPKAPAPGADFKSLFSGTILAPTIPKAPAARDQRATR